MIDEEVLEILNSSYERAKSILKTYRKALRIACPDIAGKRNY